jgi:hypothetical protein
VLDLTRLLCLTSSPGCGKLVRRQLPRTSCAVDFWQAAAGTGRERDEWTAVVIGPGAMTYSPRARKGRKYTALVMLFVVPVGWIALGAWLLAAGLGIR